jgi:hypothetical protein
MVASNRSLSISEFIVAESAADCPSGRAGRREVAELAVSGEVWMAVPLVLSLLAM